VTLTLQSLIDERLVTAHIPGANIQGLSSLTGQINSRRRGHGLEFEDLRTYATGDDVRHIDWKVSARHNQLYTRIYREEKEQRVTLVLDFTSPMFTGSVELKAITAGRMAAHFAWYLASAGARCGLLIHTDNDFHSISPALGDKAALKICAQIAEQFEQAKMAAKALQTETSTTATRSTALLARLLDTDRHIGALIMLAGLNEVDHTFATKLKELATAKQIAVLSIEDPLEYQTLPAGVFQYKSANNDTSIVLTRKQTAALKLELENVNRRITEVFAQAQVPLLQSRQGLTKSKASLIELGFLA